MLWYSIDCMCLAGLYSILIHHTLGGSPCTDPSAVQSTGAPVESGAYLYMLVPIIWNSLPRVPPPPPYRETSIPLSRELVTISFYNNTSKKKKKKKKKKTFRTFSKNLPEPKAEKIGTGMRLIMRTSGGGVYNLQLFHSYYSSSSWHNHSPHFLSSEGIPNTFGWICLNLKFYFYLYFVFLQKSRWVSRILAVESQFCVVVVVVVVVLLQ